MSQSFPSNRFSRRGLLGAGAASVAFGFPLRQHWSQRGTLAAQTNRVEGHLKITDIQRTTVRIPYREVPARNMARELPHWRYSEIVQVTLKSGYVGIGETLLYYTWGATDDDDVRRAAGGNAAELMWDDSLGAGLQMALFDAVARTLQVPVHALLGKKINARTPLSWWNIDTSPEDMAAECAEAFRVGYRSYKTKGRPWFDIWEQVEQANDLVS